MPFGEMNAEMDQIEANSGNPGICHRLLISVLPIDCPVCKALAICRRFFNFRPSAPSLAAENLLPRIFYHGWFILQRIHYSVMQILVAQPIALGSFNDFCPIQMQDFHATPSENGIGTMNDQTMQLAPHQDPSAKKDYEPMTNEKRAIGVVDSARMLTDFSSSCDCPGDEKELPQVENGTDSSLSIVQETGDQEKEQEEVPVPILLQKARAPKKMVSINDDVEIFPMSKKNRMTSKELSSATESRDEESKPLKSILKVGSKLSNVNSE